MPARLTDSQQANAQALIGADGDGLGLLPDHRVSVAPGGEPDLLQQLQREAQTRIDRQDRELNAELSQKVRDAVFVLDRGKVPPGLDVLRELVKGKRHPDKKGSTEAMVRLNKARADALVIVEDRAA